MMREGSPDSAHPASPLSEPLAELRRLTARLRALSRLCAIGTLLNVSGIALAIAGSRQSFAALTWVASVILLFVSLTALFAYDGARRRGEAIFEEVSEDLQWRITLEHEQRVRAAAPIESREPPPLDARIALREFARTTSLPLVSSGSGAALYLGVNLMAFAFQMAVAALVTR